MKIVTFRMNGNNDYFFLKDQMESNQPLLAFAQTRQLWISWVIKWHPLNNQTPDLQSLHSPLLTHTNFFNLLCLSVYQPNSLLPRQVFRIGDVSSFPTLQFLKATSLIGDGPFFVYAQNNYHTLNWARPTLWLIGFILAPHDDY